MRKLDSGICIVRNKFLKNAKNALSLILIYALIFVVLGSLFSVGVSALENGDIYYDSGFGHMTYWYDSDEAAIDDGAIAKFTHKSGDTVYVKTWKMLNIFGGDKENGADTITLIFDGTGKITLDSELEGSISGRSFTVDGKGITVECDGSLVIDGTDNGNVTLKNMTLVITSETSSALKLGNKSTQGPKVTLDNVKIIGQGSPSKATVLVQASDLILTNGSSILNGGVVNASNGYCKGVWLFGTDPSLVINDGTSIKSSGDAVYTETKSNITIKGGKLTSDRGRALYVSNKSTVVVTGGEISGGGEAVAQTCNGTLTVSGGSFFAQGKCDPETEMLGIIVSKNTTANSGKAIINGGNFYDVTGRAEWIFNCSASVDGMRSLELNAATTFGNCNVYSGKNGEGEIKTGAMICGASVRTQADSSGIRFQSTLEKNVLENIKDIDDDASIGTVIAPYDYIEKTNGIFTKDAFMDAGLYLLEIPTEKGMTDKKTYYLINAAMTDVKEKNYARDFAAVSYISYKTSEDSTVTAYGAFDSDDNVRSMMYVAYSALDDVMVDGEKISDTVTVTREYAKACGYGNVVSEWYEYDKTTGIAELKQGTAYTQYSSAQIKVIRAYIDTYVKGVKG